MANKKQAPARTPMAPVGGSRPSFAGQVKLIYTGLFLEGFVADTIYNFDSLAPGVVVTLAPRPTTTFPKNSRRDMLAVYDPVNDVLRENPKPGQVHLWRLNGLFSGKSAGFTGGVTVKLRNLTSGFVVSDIITFPAGTTAGEITATFITIADEHSLNPDEGYTLSIESTFSDANLRITPTDLVRVSLGMEVQ